MFGLRRALSSGTLSFMSRSPSFIVVAGPFPPPVTGFAYVTLQMAERIARKYEVIRLDLSVDKPCGGIGYHVQRIGCVLRACRALVRLPRSPMRVLYLACDGGLGIIYTLGLSFVGRVLGFRLFIHHHSYAYIDRKKPLMASLVHITGAAATHIFLASFMRDAFAAQYGSPMKTTVIANSAFVPLAPDRHTESDEGWITLGLLSNLNASKGLYVFLDLLNEAKAQNLKIRGILAGPVADPQDTENLSRAQAALGDRLIYKGAVYGEAKEAFFDSLDVFVFPTRYANEAQPTVLFEAMAHGLPVLSFARGCIREQVGLSGAVLEQGEDFTRFALDFLKDWPKRENAYHAATIKAAFAARRAEAQKAVDSLFHEVSNCS